MYLMEQVQAIRRASNSRVMAPSCKGNRLMGDEEIGYGFRHGHPWIGAVLDSAVRHDEDEKVGATHPQARAEKQNQETIVTRRRLLPPKGR